MTPPPTTEQTRMEEEGQHAEASSQPTNVQRAWTQDQMLGYMMALEQQLQNLKAKDQLATPKPAPPSTFGGKIGESIDTWIFKIEQYATLNPMPVEKQIPFAASYLTDNAATWWRYTFTELEKKNEEWQWIDFTRHIRAQFRPISTEKAARNRLNNLRQTASVTNYVNLFKTTVLDIPSMSEEDRMDRFLRGLKPEIHERVALQGPNSLDEACSMAYTIDTIKYQARLTNHFRPSIATQNTNGVIPMEIDAIRTKLSEAERERLKQNGGCFFCRETGHIARNCPRKKKRMTVAVIEGENEEEQGKDNAQ
jgi:Ty3 transposon capsid-like protein/Zinc knuckle